MTIEELPKKFCLGQRCSAKNTCLRYTTRPSETDFSVTMTHCTNQKKYIKDETK